MKHHKPLRPEFVMTFINVVAITVMVTVFVELHVFLAARTASAWIHCFAVGVELLAIFEISWQCACRLTPSLIRTAGKEPGNAMRDSLHNIREQIERSALLQSVDTQTENMQASVEHTQTIEHLQGLLETVLNSLESLENDLYRNQHSSDTLVNYATLKE